MNNIHIISDTILDSEESLSNLVNNFTFQSLPVSAGPHAGFYLGLSRDDFKTLQSTGQIDKEARAILISPKIRDFLEKKYKTEGRNAVKLQLESEL